MPENKITEYIGVEIILRYIKMLIQRRKIFAIIFIIINLFVLLFLLLVPPRFSAISTILPQTRPNASPLSALASAASQFSGGNLTNREGYSHLYIPIIMSVRIQDELLKTNFYSSESSKYLPLLDILNIEGDNLQHRLEKGRLAFKEMVILVKDRESEIITIKVETKEPTLSAKIVNTLVKLLDDYLLKINIDKAKHNKIFVNERIESTVLLLKDAEENLKSFRETNKRIEKSPELQLKQGRYLREVRVQEEVFLTLKRELELIKIEEVKNAPILQILDRATVPYIKSWPSRFKLMTLSILISTIIGLSSILGIIYLKRLMEIERYQMMMREIISPIKQDIDKIKLIFKARN